ncbi:anthranilate phosphoribosyltransferase [Lacticaseibacillus parakribbianus]|uniref:anthranilate phosphoribosyltransferase n=1 Tax=Lacticaseibacillus parakribbianus TaxID=2970927 RepID=UPI0021CB3086|nr:anthranilate phosphoribosyltransferase [Lacticaseibacillus parakribbianus]
MINDTITALLAHHNLSFEQTKATHDELMQGQVDPQLIASYLTAMAAKGPTPMEIAGAAASMRDNALAFTPAGPVLEIVGTGGDHHNTFNISTTSLFVIAASGVKVAKHGNRAASSKSGAADVLEALGYDIQATPAQSASLLARYDLCFLFAQQYHRAMRFVGPTRKALGFPTIFNLIGPLSNPAKPSTVLLGVYKEALLGPMAQALVQLGVTSGAVVHGQDGLDEVTVTGPTQAVMIDHGKLTPAVIDPRDYGLALATPAALTGGTPAQNATITRAVLANRATAAQRDAVVMNAGVALFLAHRSASLAAGIALAQATLASGAAQQRLNDVLAANSKQVIA